MRRVDIETKKKITNKEYSKDDLIRKPMARTTIWGLGLFMIIIGSKHIAFNGLNWEGALIGLFGILLLIMLKNAYENLLKEKDASTRSQE